MSEPDITIHETAVAIRVSGEINELLDPATMAILGRMMVAAQDEIASYAPDAPKHTANIALIRIDTP